ncbi:MAG: VWA domain-containing protein [Sumerlaeia bacterium]
MKDALESTDRQERWRLILGGGQADGIGCKLPGQWTDVDKALSELYDKGDRRGGLGSSAPRVARWLGDIRDYFKADTVRLIQKDAMERLNLQSMLLEPEMLEAVEPDVSLVANLISLNRVIPARTKETARTVVRRVVEELMKRLETPMRSAVSGALDRASRTNRPRHAAIDWNRTIRANLRHWQPDYQTIIPERLIGYARKQRSTMRDIILCVDQSGSMANSVVYSSIFAAVMASLPAVRTSLVVFDTEVVDMTEQLEDPVEVLFGVQLGGGTDINRAVGYCQSLITVPSNTILVLISDLYEGGVADQLVQRTATLIGAGVQVIVLLALSDEGAPSYDAELGQRLSNLGAPSFACTPDLFPGLMAAAIKHEDISQWAARNEVFVKQKGK